ncbi:MAG: FAD-dependent oxidoreductase [Chloroflexi bacterium]|nr:FAD-dependent oxidoreductase [Chloroflexota bacterium]
MYDLIIIGGGPAGLCAAVYAARKLLKTMLISLDIGGQVNNTWGIQNYLGYQFIEGPELIRKFESQVDQFPVDKKIGVRVNRLERTTEGFRVKTDTGEAWESRTVILATGKKSRKLGVPGETELTGRGVTYCAICDGPVFAGQRVAVVGGGNSAVGAVLDMAPIAEHVDLVSLDALTADPLIVEQLKNLKNLSIYTGYQAEKVDGDGLVSGLAIRDAAGKDSRRLDVKGVFVEIGLTPNSDLVKDLVELNRLGEVPVSCFSETTLPGLYAAGDVTDVPEKQIIIAAGEGAKAALQAHRYLRNPTPAS